MEFTKISKMRIFHKNGQVVGQSSLMGDGEFPLSVEEELKEHPGCECLEIDDPAVIEAFNASDSNTVIDGKLVTGDPRPQTLPVIPRDPLAEIDNLEKRISVLESKAIV